MDWVLIKALLKLHLITPMGFLRLIYCFICESVTIMAILRFTRFYYKTDVAIVSEREKLNYTELYSLAIRLTKKLYHKYEVCPGMRVGVLCRNHKVSALLLPALSRLGVNVRLLNTDIMSEKMANLLQNKKMDFIIYDEELREKCLPLDLSCKIISTESLQLILNESKYDSTSLPHPESVEQIINQHAAVAASKVFGVPDPDFGSVLNAVVELKDGANTI